MKKFIAALFGTLILCVPAFALDATIPQFDVYIGEDKLEFKNADYPLLLYKDITYFPMTYDYIHWLDLSSSWVDGEFYIGFHRDGGYTPVGPSAWQTNPEKCDVQLAEYKIFVNGKEIDNSKEEYPLLNFRGITYFPMTWRFATEEFNLKLSWDGNFHIDKNYDDVGIDIYAVKDSKAYFYFDKWEESVNEYGDTQYTYAGVQKGYFDTERKSFYPGEIEVDDTLPYTEAEASVENGIVRYKGSAIGDVTNFVGTKSSSGTEESDPMVSATEYKLGDMTLTQIIVYHDRFAAPHKSRVSFILLTDEKGIHSISGNSFDYIAEVMEIGGKYYVNLGTNNGWGLPGDKRIVVISSDGNINFYKDNDHSYVELIGETDGKPLVFASLKTGRQESVSLVNDGFFTIEEDVTLKKIYNYVDFSDSFIANNQLYLVLDFKGKLLNTATGEEYDYAGLIN